MVAMEWSLLVVASFCVASLFALGASTLAHLRRLVRTTEARVRALEDFVAFQSSLQERAWQLEREKDRLNHERAHLAHALGVKAVERPSPAGADVDRGRLGEMQSAALTEWAQRRAQSVSRESSQHGGNMWPAKLAEESEKPKNTPCPARLKRTRGEWSPVEVQRKEPSRGAGAPITAPLFTTGGQGKGTYNVSNDGDCAVSDDGFHDTLNDSLKGRLAGPSVVSVMSLASSTSGAAPRPTVHEAAAVDITRAPPPPETLDSLRSVPVKALGTSGVWLPRVRAAARREHDDNAAPWRSWLFGSRAASMV